MVEASQSDAPQPPVGSEQQQPHHQDQPASTLAPSPPQPDSNLKMDPSTNPASPSSLLGLNYAVSPRSEAKCTS